MKNDNKSLGIAIFVKTPGLSPVKSRLSKTIGKEYAEKVYSFLLELTKKEIKKIEKFLPNAKVYWAICEQEAIDYDCWNEFECIWQGAGQLGDKLFTIQNEVLKKHDNVIFIGSDAPFISSSHIFDAACNLVSEDTVTLGPSEDGGFYLYGSSVELPLSFWNSINYSSSTTLIELVDNLDENQNVKFLESSIDIDTLSDLNKTISYIDKMDQPNTELRKLYQLIEKILTEHACY